MLIIALISVQVIIFAGLLFFFRRILTRNVASATQHLDELNQDYTKKEEEANKLLQEARLHSEKTIETTRTQAEELKEKIIKDAETEKDKLLKEARGQSDAIIQQADRSRGALLSELDERISKEAINKACLLIESILPEEFKVKVHSQWIEELIEKSFGELKNLQIPDDITEAKVISAFALTQKQKNFIAKKLQDLLNRDISLSEEVDTQLVAGVIVKIGSLVLDGSFKNKIQQQAKNISSHTDVAQA
ncbi:MAG: F0F1 ATP synthase subunit delta [Candidatus Omnitrophota bacterium]